MLARGLAYYTGLVMEATVSGAQLGSLGGGGRYDQLGEFFGVPRLFGVGFSFGIDRICDLMEEQHLLDDVITYGNRSFDNQYRSESRSRGAPAYFIKAVALVWNKDRNVSYLYKVA